MKPALRWSVLLLVPVSAAAAQARATMPEQTSVELRLNGQATVKSVSSASLRPTPKNTETGTVTIVTSGVGAYSILVGLTKDMTDWMVRSEAQVFVVDANGVSTAIPANGTIAVRRNVPAGLNQSTTVTVVVDFSKGKRGTRPDNVLTASAQPM